MPDDAQLRYASHEALNALNCLRLSLEMLSISKPGDRDGLLDWLDAVDDSADRCARAMDLFDDPGAGAQDASDRLNAARPTGPATLH